MEKIESSQMPELLPVSKGRNTMLRAQLLQLKVGEGLFMPASEWKTKTRPYYIITRLKRKLNMTFEYGFKTDGSGWLFRRVG